MEANTPRRQGRIAPELVKPLPSFDFLIVGGGINGAGIARDAAGRGGSVLLVEQDDLASHTSSASTKLIHGGLRYLEYREFRLVREALHERARLLRIAPHIAWPLRFVLPHEAGMRPYSWLRLGLFLYDRLAGADRLPGSRAIRLAGTASGAGLKPHVRRGFAYWDAWVDDSRLVVLNAVDAARRGACILTRTRLVAARREGAEWQATLEDRAGGRRQVRARILVNAAGPFVGQLGAEIPALQSPARVRLVRGSHIVVPRRYAGDHAYILQNPDGRIVFAIPYEDKFTLIGTTDVPVEQPDDTVTSPEEIRYLCEAVNRWFAESVVPADVVWQYSGIRPLYDDGAIEAASVTRDYVLRLDAPEGGARLLSVFGGKITTYRRLAERALEQLGMPGAWTATAPLPGGDFANFDDFLRELRDSHPYLPAPLAHRLARAYGTEARTLLAGARSLPALGCDFGAGLTAAEITYLQRHEFARTADDVLWRRTRLGLHMTAGQRQLVAEAMA